MTVDSEELKTEMVEHGQYLERLGQRLLQHDQDIKTMKKQLDAISSE